MTIAVILGAGKPARGQLPSALFELSGRGRVLDWQVSALSKANAEVVFVGGYQLTEIVAQYPGLAVVVNPHWASTGTVASLLRVTVSPDRACLVSYADILYRDDLVRRLQEYPAEVVIAVDSRWRNRYEQRSAADLDAAEVVCLQQGELRSAHGRGAPGRPSKADAEYVGLTKLGPRAVTFLQSCGSSPEVSRWDMPQLLNALLAHGIAVAVVDCEGDWAELNAAQDVARFVLGTKAQTLERLAPMLRFSRIGAQVTFTVGDWNKTRGAILEKVRVAFGGLDLVVRSSALGEDSFNASGAGRFESVLGVNGADDEAIAKAVDRVAASYGDSNPAHQVLVQRMVSDIRLSGVVMTRTLSHGAPYRVINYDADSGASDAVTSGAGETRVLYLHRDRETLPAGADPALVALLEAVREIEGLVGYDSLDIEFIVSGDGQVHVLQIRPIAVDHGHWRGSDELLRDALQRARDDFRRLQAPGPFVLGKRTLFSVMSDWNPAEMIGVKPRRLAFSLYADLITREVWARQRREYGYRSVAPQALMHCFMGHPYIDVRASLNSFVPAELDDELACRLVEYGVETLVAQPSLHDKVEFEVAITCISFDFERRSQGLLASGLATDQVAHLRAALLRLTRGGVARVDADCARIGVLEKRQQAIDEAPLPPLRAALLLLDDCREHGILPFAHLARAGFITSALLNSAVSEGVISDAERTFYLQSIHTVATAYRDEFTRWRAGESDNAAFLKRYGHLRPGTYEITVPSYAQAPELYLDVDGSVAPSAPMTRHDEVWSTETRARFEEALTAIGLDGGFDTIDRFMRQAIAGREHAKFVFTRSLSQALDRIAEFGDSIGLSRETLSHLSLADLRAVDAGEIDTDLAGELRARSDAGRLAHDLSLGVELPPLLLDEDDLSGFMSPETVPSFIGSGSVTGILEPIGPAMDGGVSLSGKIVVISQADPGYDWLFAQGIAGLVTAYGGPNSHMAVRAAEFGLPAAIGVGEWRYHQLIRARRLMLDCGQRKLHILH